MLNHLVLLFQWFFNFLLLMFRSILIAKFLFGVDRWLLVVMLSMYLKLSNIENDEHHAFLGGEIDYQEVLTAIAVQGTQWKMTNGKPVTFLGIGLTRECKAWYYFLGARLMPVRYFSDITKEQAMLLYAIVTETSIDLGKFCLLILYSVLSILRCLCIIHL